jgi:hypothetical protein
VPGVRLIWGSILVWGIDVGTLTAGASWSRAVLAGGQVVKPADSRIRRSRTRTGAITGRRSRTSCRTGIGTYECEWHGPVDGAVRPTRAFLTVRRKW